MDKKQITENLISESFKNMLLKHPFEKITIKMITDDAGLIRPTFYRYFQDKYEVLEWYLKSDILDSVMNLIENNMVKEAIKMIFVRFEKNKAFYKKAFEVKGQNSFEDILYENLRDVFKKIFSQRNYVPEKDSALFTIDNLSSYYANGFVFIIKSWLEPDCQISVDDLMEGYSFIMAHPITNILD